MSDKEELTKIEKTIKALTLTTAILGLLSKVGNFVKKHTKRDKSKG